ncbi:hypothetical protein AOC36_02590 [Erysipelothrix larvae]|uniref:Phosphatidylglycerol lysyltransferase n=1 Tax=Erysipelothrix larvae TaxID=1514105 RepID=A0A109UGM7_9FIRM|nr:lysylphosphatidylglycerol synthase transmembrane domain-containing protein [Erysipelothrix larvae]AMC92910.1 hypothetical protein AOC36_02590 [Erysipelothrix larvae]
MNKKKTYINLGIVFALTLAVLVWLLHDDFETTLSVLKTSNPLYLIGALAAFITTLFTSSWILLNWVRLFKPNFTFSNMFRSNFLAVFARNVTPMQSGGQPMNVYVLNTFGVNVETSVFILSIDFVVFQTAQVLFSLVWILLYLPYYRSNNVLFWGVILGFAINSGLLVCLYLLVSSARLHRFIGKYGVKLLTKIKIVKHPDTIMDKVEQKISEFSQSLSYLKDHKGVVVKNLCIVLMGLMFTHSIPYLIAHTLNIPVGIEHYFEFVALSVFVSTYNALLPMPGGTGGLESVFMMMYGGFVGITHQNAFMILWRFVTYYFIVIAGAIYFVIFTSKKNLEHTDSKM